jgi:MFS family permease
MDWENPYSLHNMIESLDLVCASRIELGTLGGVFFAGWASTAAVIPPLSDKFGRRKVTILCMILQLPVIIGFLYSTSYYFTLLCNFSLGCLSGGRVMT